jgi:hypothetical protein
MIQFEPEKQKILKELLGLEGCVFSFAGGLPEAWIETSINDEAPNQKGFLSLRDILKLTNTNPKLDVANPGTGTIVLHWERVTEGTVFHLRINAELGVFRGSTFTVLYDQRNRVEGLGPRGPEPTSLNDIPLDEDLVLLSRTFYAYTSTTNIAEALQSPWDPKNGQKLQVTLKARFPAGNDLQGELKQ